MEAEVVLRRDRLDAAILQSALRRVVEAPEIEQAVFRAGPDAGGKVRRIAGDDARARRELETLATRDHDPTIRARAAKLLVELARRGAP